MAEAGAASAGLRKVVAGESQISFIDGVKGVLLYRGIDIHELAEHSSFEETAYLLHEGVLPTRPALDAYREELKAERSIPPEAVEVLRRVVRGHPMASLRTVVSALGALDPESGDSPQALRRRCVKLIAQTATVVAAIERARSGRDLLPPDPDLDHAANFLYMLTGERPGRTAARVMDVALVLHADHEFNASTFAARVAASTLADLHGAVTAAIATLKGPLHGGANEAVMKTLQEIGAPERTEAWVRDTLQAKRKVMGFGHAVYKTEDPRATHLRRFSKDLGAESGEKRWFAISERLEEAVRREKGLYANVDFYSASAYHALGIPTDLFTPVFAVSRIAGWTAHVREQLANNKLIRPESEYTGPRNVHYVPMDRRQGP